MKFKFNQFYLQVSAFCKFIKNYAEAIGLTLILFSFLVQLLESDIENEIRYNKLYQTQRKLDDLSYILGELYYVDNQKSPSERYFEYQKIHNNWKTFSEDKKDIDDWKESVFIILTIKVRITIFIIGSMLIIISKIRCKT